MSLRKDLVNEEITKNSSQLPCSLTEALEILETECRKAVLGAMRKGIRPCAKRKGNANSTVIDKKKNTKSN